MGSGGTEWETSDNFEPSRLNQKTRFVGKAIQSTNLITDPQVGQCVFPTSTDGTFTSNKTHFRNSANTAWVDNEFSNTEYTNIVEASVVNLQPGIVNTRRYKFITLPTTYNFYLITHLEILVQTRNGTFGKVVWGADLIDSDPPVSIHTPLISISPSISPGTDYGPTVSKFRVSSKPVKSGSVIGVWYNKDVAGGAAGDFRIGSATTTATEYNRNENVNTSEIPGTAFSLAWSTQTGVYLNDIKVYAKGYL